MPAVTLTPEDLAPFATISADKAGPMIAGALSSAALVAPCITSADFAYADAAKLLLIGAVLRWNESGTGSVQSQTTGPYGTTLDTRQPRRGLFWPSEIEQLQKMCSTSPGGAFSIEPGPQVAGGHSDICALAFGAAYCSCGYEITRLFPLYERTDY